MKIHLKLLMIASLFLPLYHKIYAMKKGSPRKDENPRESPRKEESPRSDNRRPRNKSINLLTANRVNSRSSSPRSPKRSPRTPQHILYLLGQDGLPIERKFIAKKGDDAFEALLNTLKNNCIKVFIATSDDEKESLNADCNFKLFGLLNHLNIINIPPPSTNEEFCEQMEHYKDSEIALYGMSNNYKILVMLAYWSIPISIGYAFARNDIIHVNGLSLSLNNVLANSQWNGWDSIVNHIMHLIYKRIIPDLLKRNHFLDETAEEQIKLNEYCKTCLGNIGKTRISKQERDALRIRTQQENALFSNMTDNFAKMLDLTRNQQEYS